MTRATALKRARRVLNLKPDLFHAHARRIAGRRCEIVVHRNGGGIAGRVVDRTWARVLSRVRP